MKTFMGLLIVGLLSTGCATSSGGKKRSKSKSERVEKKSKKRSDNHFNRVKDYFKQ